MIQRIKKDIEERLSRKRYLHSLRVCETALGLAEVHKENRESTRLAALLHDYAKCMDKGLYAQIMASEKLSMDPVMKDNLGLAHGEVSAILVKRAYGISDEDILNAIRHHTCGRPKMSRLEKIIYLADYIEPARSFDQLEHIRDAAYRNLDAAMLMALESSIAHIKCTDKTIHPDSIQARDYYRSEVSL